MGGCFSIICFGFAPMIDYGHWEGADQQRKTTTGGPLGPPKGFGAGGPTSERSVGEGGDAIGGQCVSWSAAAKKGGSGFWERRWGAGVIKRLERGGRREGQWLLAQSGAGTWLRSLRLFGILRAAKSGGTRSRRRREKATVQLVRKQGLRRPLAEMWPRNPVG